MSATNDTALIIIPARMASSRLPGKPLAEIGGAPMIVHVMRRAQAARCGRVIIACAEPEIKTAIETVGGEAVLTDPALPSGTDRVKACADAIDPDGRAQFIINVQGDLPLLAPQLPAAALDVLQANDDCDIATLVTEITSEDEANNPNVVKAVLSPRAADRGRALYFTRARVPSGPGPLYHHIGLYAYRRTALNRFCALPPSALEQRERLEQLRALEAGMIIDAAIVSSAPIGVDTPDDLERVRAHLEAKP